MEAQLCKFVIERALTAKQCNHRLGVPFEDQHCDSPYRDIGPNDQPAGRKGPPVVVHTIVEPGKVKNGAEPEHPKYETYAARPLAA